MSTELTTGKNGFPCYRVSTPAAERDRDRSPDGWSRLEDLSYVLEHLSRRQDGLRALPRASPDIACRHRATVAIFIAVGTGGGLT